MLSMDSSRGTVNNLIAPNDTFSDSMQFTSNYSIIGRDEQSFIARNNIQTTQSSLLGVEMGEISWMPPDEISLFQSRIMSPGTSRLPPEGAEKKSRGETKEALDVSNLSECSRYKDLLELVNKYDFEDLSVSEVPDKILPQTGGQSHSERINKLRAEGKDISVPSTEQLLALLKESEGLTPTKIYDRIMESSYSKRTENYKSTCNGQTQWKSRSTQIINQPHTIRKEQPAEIEDSKLNSKMFEDSSFVAMSASILDRDERSMMAKYGGLNKQADITCPGDQSTLPWNISNVTIFDLETTGGLPRHRFENSMQATADAKDSTRTILHDPSGLDDLVDRIYALSPSTSFSSISKMILDSARAKCDTSGAFDWSSLGGNDKPPN